MKVILLSFIKTLILLLMCWSCSKTYDVETCTDLSFKKFKGHPNSSHEFDQNCQNVKIDYTQESCQKAFNDLVNQTSHKTLKKRYGERVQECFTESDKKKYLR